MPPLNLSNFFKTKTKLFFGVVIFLIGLAILVGWQYYLKTKPLKTISLSDKYAAQVNDKKITKEGLDDYSRFLLPPNIPPEDFEKQKQTQLEQTINNLVIINEAKNLGLISEEEFQKIDNIWDYNQKAQELFFEVKEKVLGWRSGYFIECQFGGSEENSPEFKERKSECLVKMKDLLSGFEKGESPTPLIKKAETFPQPPFWFSSSFEKINNEEAKIFLDPKLTGALFALKKGEYTKVPLILEDTFHPSEGEPKQLEFYAVIIYITDSQEGFETFADWLVSIKENYDLSYFNEKN